MLVCCISLDTFACVLLRHTLVCVCDLCTCACLIVSHICDCATHLCVCVCGLCTCVCCIVLHTCDCATHVQLFHGVCLRERERERELVSHTCALVCISLSRGMIEVGHARECIVLFSISFIFFLGAGGSSWHDGGGSRTRVYGVCTISHLAGV